ncbi:MAG: hypothetical protein HN337_06065 [Deltaproteobacteria bacterium]|nr:hypothetical protein [Deltaproteobacteria bacterium]
MKNRVLIGLVVIVTAALCSCGGSGGSSSSSDIASVDSLNDIPDDVLDPQAYDHTTSSTLAQLAVPKSASLLKQAGEGNQFSRAGCESDRMKKNIIRSAIMPQMMLCHMQEIESGVGEAAAGDGVFKLWNAGDVAEGDGPQGVEEFSPRMAIKKDGDVLTLVMCNGTEKNMELVFSTASNQYSGHAIFKWGSMQQGRMDFSADGTPDSFTTASFTNSFVEDSPFWSGFGVETLEATPDYNTLFGFYNEDQDETNYAGATFARFDATQGTARYRQDSGSYPAETTGQIFGFCEEMNGLGNCGNLENDWIDGWLADCGLSATSESRLCFQTCQEGEECCPVMAEGDTCDIAAGEGHMESFTIDISDPLSLSFAVADTSIYEEAVIAATLPDSSAQPTIEFTAASADVDCSASDSWTLIEMTGEPPDTSECDALQAEMDNWDTGELCNTLDTAAAGGEQQQQ